ncbi:BTB/POZ domain-containing protein 3-like [Uloborus diversus]|uniref:BTB/POZ domain-containing protein 3-like n=1 Tax=Uloborus diversus TaxID=327109 RepID=UPI0024096033|nr:BTB/POZ domain-containing protein 3-like [Uloborus diversus]
MPPRKKMKCVIFPNKYGAENDVPRVKDEVSVDDNRNNGNEWRHNSVGVRALNEKALENKFLTDITFEVGPEGVAFKAHKLILAIASPVFEAMFYGPLAETGEKVVIPDLSPEGFHCLLKYVYTEKICFENESESFKASTAADKYCVPALKDECEKYIYKCQLSPENVWVLFENALFMGMSTIVERCLEFFKRNTKLALEVDSFLDTDPGTLEKVLQLDTLDVTELTLLKNLVRWGEHKCSSSTDEVSLKEVLEPLICHIRFGVLSADEFCSFLEDRKDLFSDADALSILQHLVKPPSNPLPDWCCTKTWRSTHMESFVVSFMSKKSGGSRHSSNVRVEMSSTSSSSSSSSSSDDTDCCSDTYSSF